MDEYKRRTDKPLLHISVDIFSHHNTMTSVDNIRRLFDNIKRWAAGKYETVITPSNINIKTDGTVVVLKVDNTTDVTKLIEKLEELGGKNDAASGDEDQMDGR